MDLKGELEKPHHEEGNRPPQEEIDISQIEVDPNATFLLGLLPLGKNSYPYDLHIHDRCHNRADVAVRLGILSGPVSHQPAQRSRSVWWALWCGSACPIWIASSSDWAKNSPAAARDSIRSSNSRTRPNWMWQFLAIRFFGLVVVVPIVEEFFVRGFLIRYVDDPDWDEQPLGPGQDGRLAVADRLRRGRPHDGAPRGPGMVLDGLLALQTHRQHLGLRRRACRDQFAAGAVRHQVRAVALVVNSCLSVPDRPARHPAATRRHPPSIRGTAVRDRSSAARHQSLRDTTDDVIAPLSLVALPIDPCLAAFCCWLTAASGGRTQPDLSRSSTRRRLWHRLGRRRTTLRTRSCGRHAAPATRCHA